MLSHCSFCTNIGQLANLIALEKFPDIFRLIQIIYFVYFSGIKGNRIFKF